MIIEKNNYFTSSTGSMSSMSKIFLSEYYTFVQYEVCDAGDAEGEEIIWHLENFLPLKLAQFVKKH